MWTRARRPVRHGADAFEAGIPHLLAAMREHGVRRLVCVSCTVPRAHRDASAFLRPRAASAPATPGAPDAHHDRAKRRCATAAVDWTIVRPAALTNAHGDGSLPGGDRRRAGCAASASRARTSPTSSSRTWPPPDYVQQTVVLTD